MLDISQSLAMVRRRLDAACKAVGRAPEAVRLLAVSKTFGADAVDVAASAGQREFGENYLQEALDKMARVARRDLVWHFIGPIQSNKTRGIAENFAWVHGVDRLKIAERLSAQRPASSPPLQICVQVNISGEASKSGCAPAETPALCAAVAQLPRLRLRGLMAIPEPGVTDPRAPYRALRELFESLQRSGLELDTLSAGMSADLEAAIAEGATLVRIGSALFGHRTQAMPPSSAPPSG